MNDMPAYRMPEWDGSVAAAHALQLELAQRLVKRDAYASPLRTVAGFDVGFEEAGTIARVAVVLLDADTLHVLGRQVARVPTPVPATPDLLGLCALPALLQALAQLPARPDMALVEGHGIAHPRRLGIAAHFGVAADLPCVGVTDEVLIGTAAALHEIRGAHTPLRDGREQVGWLLRSKPGDPPLIVSPGHRVSMASAAQLAMRWATTGRLPEPARLARELASGPRPGDAGA